MEQKGYRYIALCHNSQFSLLYRGLFYVNVLLWIHVCGGGRAGCIWQI